MQFRLPDTYPDEVPEITIMTGTGLEAGEMREMERNISQQVRLKMRYSVHHVCLLLMCRLWRTQAV